MADKPSTDAKTFAQFLNEQPAPAETVTMAGCVTRSARPGLFVLDSGGQTLELPVDAVQSYKVLSEVPQKLVELQVIASKIDTTRVVKPVVADAGVQTNPFLDHHHTLKEIITDALVDKHPHKDPVLDPITIRETTVPDPTNTLAEGIGIDPGNIVTNPAFGGQAFGAQPFVLATPHHAPAQTIAAQMGGAPAGLGVQAATTPLTDLATIFWFDRHHTFKELVKDPIRDPITWIENNIPDPVNTLAENIGVDPGGIVTNPALGAQPFGLAAQAQAAFATQPGLAQMATTPLSDLVTTVVADRPHTLAQFDQPQTHPLLDHPYTLKELIKDPIQDPITWVEGGGTIQEGLGGGGYTTNPVWNLPGMMF